MDNLAVALNMNPIEVRRRNLVPPNVFPYKTATGSVYDSGDYEVALDLCLASARSAGPLDLAGSGRDHV